MLTLFLTPALIQIAFQQKPDTSELMRRIEAKVVMPAKARALAEYDRYYRWSDDGNVIAGFVRPYPPSDPDKDCLIVDSKGERPCPPPTAVQRENYRKALARHRGPRTRQWIEGKYLPSEMIDDGGCTVVNVRYDVAADRIIETACNGFG